MKQVTLIRQYVENRFCHALRIYISTLPEREEEALKRLSGEDLRLTAEWISAHVLYALGHRVSGDGITCSVQGCEKPVDGNGLCNTHRKQAKAEDEGKPRGRPRKVPEAV